MYLHVCFTGLCYELLRLTLLALPLLVAACGPRQLEPDADIVCDQCDRWNEPQEPFRIHGNTWYVGTTGLTSILIETDDGLVLVDGGLPQSAALIDANIRGLGFDSATSRRSSYRMRISTMPVAWRPCSE